MTADKVLGIARKEIGTREKPAGSNRVKYAEWYGMNGQPWCVMFVNWCFNESGAYILLPTKTASCTALMNAAKSKGMWVTDDYKIGDIPIYNFKGSYHTGIIEAVNATTVTAIEGNTAIGNDSNGGEVMRRTRSKSNIMGAVRPKYEKEAVILSETDLATKWAVDNVLINDGNWNATPTRRQIAIILYRFAKLIGKA
jgi:hypothetical protein